MASKSLPGRLIGSSATRSCGTKTGLASASIAQASVRRVGHDQSADAITRRAHRAQPLELFGVDRAGAEEHRRRLPVTGRRLGRLSG